jgi:hypothetical protein
MTTQIKPLSEVSHEAIRLLAEKIGIVDTFRFINRFTSGNGDYTREREELLGHLTLDDIVSPVENRRRG